MFKVSCLMKSVTNYLIMGTLCSLLCTSCDQFYSQESNVRDNNNLLSLIESEDDSYQQLQRVTVLLNDTPNPGHGGFYHADISDMYEKNFIDVEFIPADHKQFMSEFVTTSVYDFAIIDGDVFLEAVADNDSIVALMAPLQRTPISVYYHSNSIDFSLTDFDNGTIATWAETPSSIFLQSMLASDSITWTEYPGNVRPFLVDESMMFTGYSFLESSLLESLTFEFQSMSLDSLDYNPYGSVLVTRREMIDSNPVIVEAFVKASQVGWNSYITDFESTNEVISKFQTDYTSSQLNRSANKVSSHMKLLPDGTFEYTMTAERWNKLNNTLVELEIKEPQEIIDEVHFTNRFLD